MTYLNRFLSVSTLLLVVSTNAFGDGTIAGSVTRAGSLEPLGGASISVMQKTKHEQAEIKYQAITNHDGNFSIAGIANGDYSVAAFYPGLRPIARETVKVTEGQTVSLNFPLGGY